MDVTEQVAPQPTHTDYQVTQSHEPACCDNGVEVRGRRSSIGQLHSLMVMRPERKTRAQSRIYKDIHVYWDGMSGAASTRHVTDRHLESLFWVRA